MKVVAKFNLFLLVIEKNLRANPWSVRARRLQRNRGSKRRLANFAHSSVRGCMHRQRRRIQSGAVPIQAVVRDIVTAAPSNSTGNKTKKMEARK